MTAVPCALFAASTVFLLFAVRNADRARLQAEAHRDAWRRTAERTRELLAETVEVAEQWRENAGVADLSAVAAWEFVEALCFGDKEKETGE